MPAIDSSGLEIQLIGSVTILPDGSERQVNRPNYDQKGFYSEKNQHSSKNYLIVCVEGKILCRSDTYQGKVHAKSICDIKELEINEQVSLIVG